MDIFLIHGAPGTGKSSVAQALHERLNSPWFEFGWISEFRQKGEALISYDEEERLSFENLCLVVQNYLRHGFRNIILSDLRDPIARQVPRHFSRRNFKLVTLWVGDQELLKQRVLDPARSSGYRDWEEALVLNRLIATRPAKPYEIRFNTAEKSVEQIVDELMKLA